MTSKIITIVGLIVIVILLGLIYNKYQTYKAQKQQQVEQLMSQQQKIVAEQRAAVGELKNVGLSEQGKKNLEKSTNAPITAASPTSMSVSSPYRCDGRQHCSQMNSRAEAEWFVRNCSDNKMDGDRDGIPCENDSRW